MKVVHVIARMNVGGTANYVSKLVKLIPNSILITGEVQGNEIEDSSLNSISYIKIPTFGRKIDLLNDFKSYLHIRKVLREIKPDIVHSHTFKAGTLSRLIRGKFIKIHTFHGHLFEDPSFSNTKKYLIKLIEKFLGRRTDLLISVGVNVGNELRGMGVATRGNWTSIAPGISEPLITDKQQARRQLGIASDEILIGWLARVVEVKRPDLFVALAIRNPEMQFILGGGGDLLDSVTTSAPINLKCLGWTNSNLFWSAVDIGISTSQNEGIPIALIEAQMAGVPLIATNVGGTNEIIVDGNTGFLVPIDLDEIEIKLKKLVADRTLFRNFGLNARELTRSKFSVNVMIESHLKKYNELIKMKDLEI